MSMGNGDCVQKWMLKLLRYWLFASEHPKTYV